MDECDYWQYISPCSEFALCTNTVGSYECECFPHFTGDGRNCTGLYSSTYFAQLLFNSPIFTLVLAKAFLRNGNGKVKVNVDLYSALS